MKYELLTNKIIEAFYKVYNTLGYGFLEKVYENALCIELTRLGLDIKQQSPISVKYQDYEVGNYFADLIINDTVIVELKAIEQLSAKHRAQLLNYLKATGKEVGLLLNFGNSPEIKRLIYSDEWREDDK